MNRVSQFQRGSFQIIEIIITEIIENAVHVFFLKGPRQSISSRASRMTPPRCYTTGVPPQGYTCAANFYKTLYIRTS
jgi:hypothetical protein